jgi:hypothetical protein
MTLCAAPAAADDPPPGCERVPIFGLNPQVRKICDDPIQPDGSWVRARQFSFPSVRETKCAGNYYSISVCPPSLIYRVDVPKWEGPIDTYIVTPDTIPAGEPGHLD